MLLPTKRLPIDRSLLVIGGSILQLLDVPKTVSRLWDEARGTTNNQVSAQRVTYHWFLLALDFLFAIGAITLEQGEVRKQSK